MEKSKSYKKFESATERLQELKIEQKEKGDFAQKEAHARATGRLIEASGWKERQNLWKHLRKERVLFEIKNGLETGRVIFETSKTARELYKFIKSVVKDWLLAQYKFEGEPTNIEAEVDSRIPFRPEDGMDYLSYLYYWITPLGFLHKEFGEKIKQDIARFLSEMAAFYAESGMVFRKAQTTIEKPTSGNAALRFARAAAKPLDLLPSLHVQMVGRTIYDVNKILTENQNEPEQYSRFREELLNRGVRILETCLTTKQHGVRDIAAGFVALSGREPEFDENLVGLIVGRMFEKPVFEKQIEPDAARETKEAIMAIYRNLITKVKTENKHYTEVLIEFIKNIRKSDGKA